MKLIVLILLSFIAVTCTPQIKKEKIVTNVDLVNKQTDTQIGEYVTSAYEDTKGNLWFGTIQKGIAQYDGYRLKYFTKKDGLPSDRVTSVLEDDEGMFWFNTDKGVVKFDGQKFTNFLVTEDNFYSNMISQLFIDSKGNFWVGTWGGVFRFEKNEFIPFQLPYPDVETPINKDTKNWITKILEDQKGNLWFARDGYGACKYDGQSFKHYLKRDGLLSNNVTELQIDAIGNVWIGTRVAEMDNPDPTMRIGDGGVNKLVDGEIISFPKIDGFNDSDVHEIYMDNSTNIWISTKANGVYKYDGTSFTNYNVPTSIMGIKEDRKGTLWLAGAGGLYKINQNDEVVNVSTEGPWH